jgi:hypothetical protein
MLAKIHPGATPKNSESGSISPIFPVSTTKNVSSKSEPKNSMS